MTALQEVALLRLAAQRIVGPKAGTAVEAVRWLTAVQAQDFNGALTSVALRTASRRRTDVEEALDAGEVVRSWPMRGTLHLLAAEDLPWMLRLLAPRVVAATVGRRTGLGLTTSQLEQAREVAQRALSGGGRLRRTDLYAVWEDAGLATTGQRGVHMVSFLAMTGTLAFGPTNGGEQLIVLVDEWVPRPRALEGEGALGELARRYFRSHGPATIADLTRWANLRITDARIGTALARPQLDSMEVDGVEHLMDPRTPEVLRTVRNRANGVLLLPGFDEFILGYGDRSAQLEPEFADRIVPGGNGVFRDTVVSAGRVVGTWRRHRQGIEATPFTAFTAEVDAAIPELFAALP